MASVDKWDRLIMAMPVDGFEIMAMGWEESRRFYQRVRSARRYGYDVRVTHLWDGKYFVGKVADGREDLYMAAVRRRPGKGEPG